jgi:hypothetical protein
MTWYRLARRLAVNRRVIAAVLVGLALIISYQAWAWHQTERATVAIKKANRTAVAVKRLTKVQCANTRLFYDVINALAEDSSPAFGSPPTGIQPGAREALIHRLYESERRQAPALARQGCVVRVPPG